ncbi:MAG TPA: hypothetical protein PLY87_02090 [Planctomycetaceae bacterium]|nr:hypothetical protein [Planctomycetaceae bacterium]HQZ63831.1 hypothetical protein [Planctomycetaceae bacterium]
MSEAIPQPLLRKKSRRGNFIRLLSVPAELWSADLHSTVWGGRRKSNNSPNAPGIWMRDGSSARKQSVQVAAKPVFGLIPSLIWRQQNYCVTGGWHFVPNSTIATIFVRVLCHCSRPW